MTPADPNRRTAPEGLLRDVAACRACPAAVADLCRLYAEVDAAVAAAGGICDACGLCCRFDQVDHRLYATALELALLTARPAPQPAPAALRCAYQLDNACGARDVRCLGCRIHHCRMPPDAATGLYERFHAELRTLHDRHALPYAYAELTGVLAAMTER